MMIAYPLYNVDLLKSYWVFLSVCAFMCASVLYLMSKVCYFIFRTMYMAKNPKGLWSYHLIKVQNATSFFWHYKTHWGKENLPSQLFYQTRLEIAFEEKWPKLAKHVHIFYIHTDWYQIVFPIRNYTNA